jgi:hypothetical protein
MSSTEPPRPPTQSPIPANSRYAGVEIATSIAVDGEEVRWFRRRFVPAPEEFATSHDHVVRAGERLDLIADIELGDAELWWRVADANRAMRPADLTDTPGRRLHIAQPQGFPGTTP